MNDNHPYKIFIKYLLSYIILLLLPITLIAVLVYSFFVNQLEEEVIAGNLNTLDNMRESMDEQLSRIEDTTRQMLIEDNSLYPYRISDQWGYKAWGITRELKRYQRMSPFIHEIWVYFKSDPAVFTSSGVYSLPMISKQIYQFEDWSASTMITDLQESRTASLLSPGYDEKSHERYLRMIQPMFPNQAKPYGTIVYLINEKSIHQLMSTYEKAEGSMWIFDQNNQLVTSVAKEGSPTRLAFSKLITEGTHAPYQEITLEGTNYYLFLMQSEQSGWKYATLLPIDVVMDKVNHAQNWLTYGIIAILIVGGGIIYISMRSNYRPIHMLRKESHRLFPHKMKSLNELETVRYTLTSLANQNKDLDNRVKNHSPAVKKQMVFALLKGEIESFSEIAKYDANFVDLTDEAQTQVIIIETAEYVHSMNNHTIQEMERSYPGPHPIFGIEHFDSGRYVFLLLIQDSLTEDTHACWDQYQDRLRALLGGTVTLGVGTRTLVSDSPRSYLEAQTAMDYRFIQGVNRVIRYDEIPMNFNHQESYPHSEMESLQRAVRKSRMDKIQSSLSNITDFIRQKQVPLIIARSLCYDVIRSVNDMWTGLGMSEQHSAQYPDIFVLERLETIDEFEKLIHSISQDLSVAFKNQNKETPSKEPTSRSIDLITQYIEGHFDQCEFSLQGMSESFGMALPNLSQLFKEQTGQTPLEYVTELRMKKAQHLLMTTMKPLSSVAEEVGYYNVSSFIRRFKQLNGMTPGEYRNRAQAPDFKKSDTTTAQSKP
ncbi:helix-turn-helix domain-containing protein [Paenibacillus sp. MABNR03]|uniref:helix-turn-helix domain-containing protein n=1 Tax=Paenibacillus sp. MABNR03 TaxID=3142626 RepID=UPI003D28C07B